MNFSIKIQNSVSIRKRCSMIFIIVRFFKRKIIKFQSFYITEPQIIPALRVLNVIFTSKLIAWFEKTWWLFITQCKALVLLTRILVFFFFISIKGTHKFRINNGPSFCPCVRQQKKNYTINFHSHTARLTFFVSM